MDDNQFWVAIWRIIGLGALGLSIILMVSCQVTKVEIAQSIKAGVDPMQAACALSTNAYGESVCVAAMMRKQDK